MTKIKLTNKSDGSWSYYSPIVEHNLNVDPMTFKVEVDMGIDPEGNQQIEFVDREFSKADFTAQVIEDE